MFAPAMSDMQSVQPALVLHVNRHGNRLAKTLRACRWLRKAGRIPQCV